MIYEQMSLFAPIQQDVAFSFTQMDIDKVLCGGSGFSWGKLRIYEQFQKRETEAKNIAFLKREYGIGGHSASFGGIDGFVDYDGKGLTIKTYKPRYELVLSWSKVAKRLAQLIASGKYVTTEQLDCMRKEQDD